MPKSRFGSRAQWQASLLVLAAIVVGGLQVLLPLRGTALTPVESAVLQVLTLALSLVGAAIFGKQSARDAARDIVKPHARSAFRRMLSLSRGLVVLKRVIEAHRQAGVTPPEQTLAVLEALVGQQLMSANDAIEDWRDLVPEDVKELESNRLLARSKEGE